MNFRNTSIFLTLLFQMCFSIEFTSYNAMHEINDIGCHNDTAWLATNGGVVKMAPDGEILKKYTTVDGLISNITSAVFIGQNDTIIFGTTKGISFFDGESFKNYYLEDMGAGFQTYSVFCITVDKDGNKWFGTYKNGLLMFDGTNWTVFDSTDHSSLQVIRSVCIDSNDNVWVGTDHSALIYNDTGWVNHTEVSVVNKIFTDSTGLIWFGLNNNIITFNGTQWDTVATLLGNDIQLDTNGIMHILHENSYSRYYEETFHEVNVSSSRIKSFEISNKNAIWLGIRDERGPKKATFGSGMELFEIPGPKNNSMNAIIIDKDDNKWFTSLEGLNKFDNTSWEIDINSEIHHPYGMCIDSNDNLWVSGALYLHMFDGTDWNIVSFSLGHYCKMFCSSNGEIWITASDGLTRINDSVNTSYDSGNGLLSDRVNDIDEDKYGNIWIATSKGGSCLSKDTTWTHYDTTTGLKDETVYSVAVDPKDNIWFGTTTGLYKLMPDSTWSHISSATNPLMNDTVRAIASDKRNGIWASTHQGLLWFNGEEWRKFTTADGLAGNVSLVIYVEDQEHIWLPTSSGATEMFVPISTPTNQYTKTSRTISQPTIFLNHAQKSLNISFKTLSSGTVSIKIFSANGKLIKTSNQFISLDKQQIKLDINSISSGNYYIKLETKAEVYTGKLLFL